MVALRSREILPPKPNPEPQPERATPEPATPSRAREPSLYQPSPSPAPPVTGSMRTRSQRLALQSDYEFALDERNESLVGLDENGENVFDFEAERETPSTGSTRRRSQRLGLQSDLVNGFALDEGKESLVGLEENGVNVFDLGDERESDGRFSRGLSLRSGKRVAPRTVEHGNRRHKRARGSGLKGKKEEEVVEEASENDGAVLDSLIDNGDEENIGKDRDGKGSELVLNGSSLRRKRCIGEEKGTEIEESDGSHSGGRRLRGREEKGKVIDDDNAHCVLPNKYETKLEGEMMKSQVSTSNVGSSSRGRTRYSNKEKGKAKLVGDDASLDNLKMEMESKVKDLVENLAESAVLDDEKQRRTAITGTSETRMEQFRDIARQNASRFAHFDIQEAGPPDVDVGAPTVEEEKIEDWPGPFSTAMRIIRDRANKLNSSNGTSTSEKAKPAPITWIPKNNKSSSRSKALLPSLQELCMRILVKNVDSISSLDCVPDALRHRLCQLLCDSRRMNLHFFSLLVCGSPTEIRIRDCSWLTEEDFEKCFAGCDTNNLMVLQLDQCGRCMPDYTLGSALAQSPNSLPTLTTLSLSGGCRISDIGLSSIVSSAPALKSLNISRCSLLSSASIEILANSLESVLQELYIDDCQNLNAMVILPALKKLQQLQILSVAGIQTVCDTFLKEFLAERGHNMKELILADCVNLTDSSVKVIAETCPGLCALDLVNLRKLTDSALGYLANGCREIQKLKLRRNSFSDEAIAAFVESSGEILTELSLNNVKKVDHNTALSLARRSRNLQSLDLSWCRNLTDEAVGLIVDSCLSLKVLKLFGCGQITNVFLHGHSNPEVQIVGLKMSLVLDYLPRPTEYPLHYSSVSSSL